MGANLLEVRKGDLVAYDPVRDRARLFLSQDNFRRRDGSRGGSANIDAVFVHTDGTLLLSTSAAARLGAPPHTLEMSKGDLVLYDPVADTARVVLGSEIYRTRGGEPGAVADIDAVHWLGGGRLLFSTFAAERVGANALLVKDGDVILYDSAADTAEVFMQERTFRRSNGDLGGAADIDGLSMGRR